MVHMRATFEHSPATPLPQVPVGYWQKRPVSHEAPPTSEVAAAPHASPGCARIPQWPSPPRQTRSSRTLLSASDDETTTRYVRGTLATSSSTASPEAP